MGRLTNKSFKQARQKLRLPAAELLLSLLDTQLAQFAVRCCAFHSRESFLVPLIITTFSFHLFETVSYTCVFLVHRSKYPVSYACLGSTCTLWLLLFYLWKYVCVYLVAGLDVVLLGVFWVTFLRSFSPIKKKSWSSGTAEKLLSVTLCCAWNHDPFPSWGF